MRTAGRWVGIGYCWQWQPDCAQCHWRSRCLQLPECHTVLLWTSKGGSFVSGAEKAWHMVGWLRCCPATLTPRRRGPAHSNQIRCRGAVLSAALSLPMESNFKLNDSDAILLEFWANSATMNTLIMENRAQLSH